MPLRVFEPRYLDMISRCFKDGSQFGVILIRDGSEVGAATTHSVGTLAYISDWYQGSDGILGVTAIGTRRFRLASINRQGDGLYLGGIEVMEPEPTVPLPDEFQSMADLLEAVVDDLGRLYQALEKQYQDATWVGCRFAEILPVSVEEKQHCLEMNDPIERLRLVQPLLRSTRKETEQ